MLQATHGSPDKSSSTHPLLLVCWGCCGTTPPDGLPQGITEKDVEEFFGSIGIIKTDKKTRGKKIWLYRDKATGALKGDGTVSYEDPFSAGSAVEWFNNKDWKGVTSSLHSR